MKTAAYIPLHRAVPLFLCPRWLLLRRIRPLFYINGPDVLPQPLSREEEANALRALESGGQAREAARALLIERNLRLVAFLARRFENTGVGIEDLISIGTLGLIKAVETFRSDKNIKLATYASRCIENEILMYLRKISGRQEVSIDEPLNSDWDGGELLLSDILSSDEPSVVEELERDAEAGRRYRKELREETVRLGLLAGLGVDRELLLGMTDRLSLDELSALKKAWGGRAAQRYPIRPQLGYGEKRAAPDSRDGAFLI